MAPAVVLDSNKRVCLLYIVFIYLLTRETVSLNLICVELKSSIFKLLMQYVCFIFIYIYG